MCALFFIFICGDGGAEIIEIGHKLTDLPTIKYHSFMDQNEMEVFLNPRGVHVQGTIAAWPGCSVCSVNEGNECGAGCQEADVDKAVAALWLIGGIDSRLRLGGTVRHDEFGRGTVASIATSGKISVQFDGIRNMKTCRMQDLEPVSSSSVDSDQSSV